MFGTNFSTKDTQSFYNYYQDIAKKVKDKKVDILLVVNMFLTGFDSRPLNTMYVDFELELIHRDVINVQYILTLLANLYDADEKEQAGLRKLILDTVSGDLELRNKSELIEKFIEQTLPKVGDTTEIPDTFEAFWETELLAAFDRPHSIGSAKKNNSTRTSLKK